MTKTNPNTNLKGPPPSDPHDT